MSQVVRICRWPKSCRAGQVITGIGPRNRAAEYWRCGPGADPIHWSDIFTEEL